MQNIAQSPVVVAAVHHMAQDFDTFVLRPHKFRCVEVHFCIRPFDNSACYAQTKKLIQPEDMEVTLDKAKTYPLLATLGRFIHAYHGENFVDPSDLLDEIRR